MIDRMGQFLSINSVHACGAIMGNACVHGAVFGMRRDDTNSINL